MCIYCQKDFGQEYLLTLHVKIEHPGSFADKFIRRMEKINESDR